MPALLHSTLPASSFTTQGRLRANAEAVAFYRGVAKEGELLRSSFRDVVQHQARVLGKQWRFGMVQVGRQQQQFRGNLSGGRLGCVPARASSPHEDRTERGSSALPPAGLSAQVPGRHGEPRLAQHGACVGA